MDRFTADAAAFYGLGLFRRAPATLAGVALLTFVFGLFIGLAIVPAAARAVVVMFADSESPEVVFEALIRLWSSAAWIILLGTAFSMITLGALNRALVHGRSEGWALGLKLGMDELRVFIVSVVVQFIVSAAYSAASWGGFLIAFALAASVGVVGMAGDPGAMSGAEPSAGVAVAIAFLAVFAAYVAGAVLAIWIGVRLSFAAAASVGEGRFVIFESWGMTKGRFWTLFLAYVLLFVIAWAVELVVFAVVFAAFWGSGVLESAFLSSDPGIAKSLSKADVSGMTALALAPAVVVLSAVGAVLFTVFGAAFHGVAARGYLDWKAAADAPAVQAG